MTKLTKQQLKEIILEELPTTKRGPGIRVEISFDLVPGPAEKLDLNNFRAKLRNFMASLSSRAVSDNHETEVKPTNASITTTGI